MSDLKVKLSKQDRKLFYALMLPALAENLLARIFHIADSMMLGQMPNSTLAVAAGGLCASPINMIISVSSAFFIGTTATIAWHYGADEKRRMRTSAWQSMGLSVIIAVILALITAIFAPQIMGFVFGGNEAYSLAVSYYRINSVGFLFQIMTAAITASLRGIGISKISLYYNAIGGVVNVVLNYALIYGKWGLPALASDGAAIATVIAKFVSFAIALTVIFFKKTELDIRLGIDKKLEKSLFTRTFPIGITAAGEQVILQSGAIVSARILSTLPITAVASNQIISSIEAFAWATGGACQTASTSLFGRALGKHDEPQARAFLRLSVTWALFFAAAEILLFIFFGKPIARMFTNDSSLYSLVTILLLFAAAELPFVNVHSAVSGALRSAGDSIAPLIASFLSLWIFRVFAGFITVSVLDLGIYAFRGSIIADQFVRCTIIVIFYLTGHWKKYLFKKK